MKIKCGLCGSNRTHNLGKYRKEQEGVIQCDPCGGTRIKGVWKLICKNCGKEVKDKLYDLFVPHNCKECSDKLHKDAEEKGDKCGLCSALRMDCVC